MNELLKSSYVYLGKSTRSVFAREADRAEFKAKIAETRVLAKTSDCHAQGGTWQRF